MGIFFDSKEEKLQKQKEQEKRNDLKTHYFKWDKFLCYSNLCENLYSKNINYDRYFVFENNNDFETFKTDLKKLHDSLFNDKFNDIDRLTYEEIKNLTKEVTKLDEFIISSSIKFDDLNIKESNIKKYNIYSQRFDISFPYYNNPPYISTYYRSFSRNCCFFVRVGKNESSKHTPKEYEEIEKHINDTQDAKIKKEEYEEQQRLYKNFCSRNNLDPTFPLSMHLFLKEINN